MNLQPTTDMSIQDQARAAFRELLSKPGPLTSATLLANLGNELHRECGFRGTLRTSADLLLLSDEHAAAAVRLIPTLQASSSGPDAFVRDALRKKSDS